MPILSGLVPAPSAVRRGVSSRSLWALHLLVVAIAWLAVELWSARDRPAVETGYLIILLLASLLPAALGSGLRPGSASALRFHGAAVLFVLAVLAVPAGPLRSLALLAPLLLGLGALLPDRSLVAARAELRGPILALLAVAAQLLLRLPAMGPEPALDGAAALRLFGWPLLTALGLLIVDLGEEWRRWTVWVTAAALFVAGGGFGIASTATAWALAAAWLFEVGRRRTAAAGGAAALLAAGLAAPALAVVLALALWALRTPRRWLPAVVVAAGLLSLLFASRPWSVALDGTLLLHLILPLALPLAVLGGPESRREAGWMVLSATVLALLALRFLPATLALPVPALLLARALSGSPARLAWTVAATWAALSLVLANLPLLRGTHLVESLPSLLVASDARLATVLLVTAAWTGGALHLLARRRAAPRALLGWPPLGLPAVVLLATAVAPIQPLLSWPPTTLDALAPSASWTVLQGRARTLQIDAFLAGSAAVPDGRQVAAVRALSGDRLLLRRPIRVGADLGDWAADAVGSTRPRPFLSWVGGGFYAHSYRLRMTLPQSTDRVVIERASGLPAETSVTLRAVTLVTR